jgi:hypothetical protein
MFEHRWFRHCGAAALSTVLLVGAGCGASGKKPAVDLATANPTQRREAFEATLRTLDEHPEYVDELFALSLRHPVTLDRFIRNSAAYMHEEQVAKITAAHLVKYPRGLELVLVRTLDAAADNPDAKRAIGNAMQQRAGLNADVLAGHPEALRVNVNALVDAVMSRPPARKAFLRAMSEKSPLLAQLLVNNPEALEAVLRATVRVGLKRDPGQFLGLLKELTDRDAS